MEGTPQPFSWKQSRQKRSRTVSNKLRGSGVLRLQELYQARIKEAEDYEEETEEENENEKMQSHLPFSDSFLSFQLGKDSLLMGEIPYADNIYGNILLDAAIVRLINTPQFERLNGLAQLGTCQYVYRTATHTRFVHSIGVSHLAGKMVENFMRYQPYLNITQEDLLCVKIAGLCHDLGHGPYSHLWEKFMRNMGSSWTHEKGSIDMFRHMLSNNNIDLREFGLSDADLVFIEEMILGVDEKERQGRSRDKEFLYYVINNTSSGLDVDKLDYLTRDSKDAGLGKAIQIDRFINLARVCWALDGDGVPRRLICYPEKMAVEVSELFSCRMLLHAKLYQHHMSNACDLMLLDIFAQSVQSVLIPGSVTLDNPSGLWPLNECTDNMCAFTKLKDSVVDLIECSTAPELQRSRELISRLRNRDMYRLTFHANWDDKLDRNPEKLKERFFTYLNTSSSRLDTEGNGYVESLSPDDLVFKICLIHCGKGDQNPVEHVRFYDKMAKYESDTADTPLGHTVDVEMYEKALPRFLCTTHLRVFVKLRSKRKLAKKMLEGWCRQL